MIANVQRKVFEEVAAPPLFVFAWLAMLARNKSVTWFAPAPAEAAVDCTVASAEPANVNALSIAPKSVALVMVRFCPAFKSVPKFTFAFEPIIIPSARFVATSPALPAEIDGELAPADDAVD